jgi:hypothetical protein
VSPLATLPASALPLAEAVRKFVPRELWVRYERAHQEFARLPPGPGVERLRFVIGLPPTKTARDDIKRAWERIEQTFTEKLVAGFLTLYVQKEPPFGMWQALAPQLCRGMRIKDLPKGHVTASNFELVGVYVAEAQLSVADEVAATTGAPGRPTSIHLVVAEFERRAKAGNIERNLPTQSEVLARWLKANHPRHPPLKPKTIENKLRHDYRRLTATSNQKPPKL